MRKKKAPGLPGVRSYWQAAAPELERALGRNEAVLERLAARVAADVRRGRSLHVFGSGHSAIFALELYHRAGGASFVVPCVPDFLLPTAGPSAVRVLERTAGVAGPWLARSAPRRGEMLWLASQSGINPAIVDLALEARRRGLRTVAFTSRAHSRAVPTRHASGKRLFEVCDEVVDLGGVRGDACVPLSARVSAGPLSSLLAICLGHSILVAACGRLERQGRACVYTSVNTPEGERRNRAIEARAALRDPRLR